MTIEERLGLQKYPLAAYSGSGFEAALCEFHAARTLRTQYSALSDMIFAAAEVTIGGKEYCAIVPQSKFTAYVPLHHTIGITHTLRKQNEGVVAARPSYGYRLSGVFIPSRANNQTLAMCYDMSESGSLAAVRVADPCLPLRASTSEVDVDFKQSTGTDDAFGEVAAIAKILRSYVSTQVFDNLVFLNGRVEIAS